MPARKRTAKRPKPPCPHPSQHVHPTFDARFETCDLCHITAPAPINAPWIMAHDAGLPAEEPPALFAGAFAALALQEAQPVHAPAPALVVAEPRNIRCPRCEGNRRVNVEPVWPNNAPPESLKAWIRCPRCQGAGAIVAYHVEPRSASQKVQAVA